MKELPCWFSGWLTGSGGLARLLGLVVISVVMGACGGDETAKSDPCAEIICDGGVCDKDTKSCVNPTTCDATNTCVPGYECSDEGACVPTFQCEENSDCERGVCSNGACVNPGECAIGAECLDGFYCTNDGVCARDLCEDTTCDRGECRPSDGQCVNAAVCSRATETSDCVEGFYCYPDRCVSGDEVCAALDCESQRGVCDPAARACVNADNCQGDDTNCQEGYFCNASNRCEENRCDSNDQCVRGVCEPSSGQCANPSSCSAAIECLDAHYCIDGGCQPVATACAACPGTQVCTYDDAAGSVSCSENPSGCNNAFDCLDGRSCIHGVCSEPVACVPDEFEPNDTVDEAISINDQQGVVRASICSGDTDVFSFDTRGHGLTRGTMLVEVRYASEDVGHGNLTVRVRDAAGNLVDQKTDTNTGVVFFAIDRNASQRGIHYIEVLDSGDVRNAGIRYTVYADFVGNDLVQACRNAIPLSPGTVSGDTRQGASYEMNTSCTPTPNTAHEIIYHFSLDGPAHVELSTRPALNAVVTMALRQNCLSRQSEVDCQNPGEEGHVSRIRTQLDAGDYYVIVKGPSAQGGGAFELTYTMTPIVCTPNAAYCDVGGRSNVCNAAGTGFDRVSCPSGCNNDSGYCNRRPGDACYAAIDATGGYTGEIRWNNFNSEYRFTGSSEDVESCLPASHAGRTVGPDVAYVVELPGGHALEATLTTSSDYATLVVVEDCQQTDATCLASAYDASNPSPGRYVQNIVWTNPSEQLRRYYVLAMAGVNWAGIADIDITTGPVVCTPGETRCAGEELLEECNASGTAFVTGRSCPFGCDEQANTCNPVENDTCKGAVDILARGGKFSGRIEDYTNSYDPGSTRPQNDGCTGVRGQGPDAVVFVDASEGDVISATLNSDFDAMLWITTDCSRAGQACLQGSRSGEGATERVYLTAPQTGRYFLVVDSLNSSQRGNFDLNVSVDLPMCPPGELLGCVDDRTLAFCGDLGAPVLHTCETGCTGMACDRPSGDVCPDAIPVQSGEVVTGLFRGSNTLNLGNGQWGQCDFERTDATIQHEVAGPDTFYAVEMTAGQVLRVNGSLSSNFTDGIFFIMEDCHDRNSCMANSIVNVSPKLYYHATEDRTVYVVASTYRQTSSTSNSYTLQFDIADPVCTTGARQCGDVVTAQYCNDLGVWEDIECPTGCEDGFCRSGQSGDTCADAIPLKNLTSMRVNSERTATISPLPGINGQCDFGDTTSQLGDGVETIFTFDLEAGQTLRANVRSGGGGVAYILETCGETNSCVLNTPYDINGHHTIEFVAERTGSYYLVIDRSSSGSIFTSQNFTIEAQILTPDECVPGESACLEDGETLGICGEDGYWGLHPCDGGCDQDACNEPNGGHCLDVPTLESGVPLTKNYANADNQLARAPMDLENTGVCDFSDLTEANSQRGTRTYAVELRAGEHLTARLDGGGSATSYMYLTSSCDAGSSQCITRTPLTRVGELTYQAAQDETLYLVVSQTGTNVGTMTVTAFIQQPGCNIGAMECLPDGKSLGVCGNDGVLTDLYACDGECSSGECTVPTGDSCYDALELEPGFAVTGTWGGTNRVEYGPGVVDACDFGTTSTQGRDTIYRVSVPDNTIVDLTLATNLSPARIYVLNGCSNEATCELLGAGQGNYRFYAELGGDYFVVVDSTAGNAHTNTYTLEVAFETPECVPGTRRCGATEGTVEVCDAFGTYTSHVCSSGTCQDGVCEEPDGLSCSEVRVIGPGVTVDTVGDDNNFTSSSGTHGQCTFSTTSAGGERVYAIDVPAGQVLTVNLSSVDTYRFMHLQAECGELNTCLDATMDRDGYVQYRAQGDERVYLVVDRRLNISTNRGAEHSLEVDIRAPECTPGAKACSDDGDVVMCNANGVYMPHYGCTTDGCTDGACNAPQGDICEDVIPFPLGQTVSDNFRGSNSVSSGTGVKGQCHFTTSTTRGDHIYTFEVQAGQVVHARIDTAYDGSVISLLTACNEIDTCLASAAAVKGQNQLFYEATQNERLYLKVDGDSTTGFGAAYSLYVDALEPECDLPGDRICSLDGHVLECNEYGIYETLPCTTGCSNGACEDNSGATCHDAILVEAGQVYEGNWGGVNNLGPNVDMGQCTFPSSPAEGPETFYAVAVTTGDWLRIELDTTYSSAHLYVVEDCRDMSTCMASIPTAGAGVLQYQATYDGVVYIVVDKRFRAAEPGQTYSLRVDISREGECVPGDSYCDGGDRLVYCTSRGMYDSYTCSGSCVDGACTGTGGDHCFEATPIAHGARITNPFTTPTPAVASHDPGTETCMLSYRDVVLGPDRVYSIELEEGDLLDVTITTTQANVRSYILDSCSKTDAEACIYSAMYEKDFKFRAPETKTYYLVMDVQTTSATTRPSGITIDVAVEKVDAVCQPGRATCDETTGVLSICNDEGTEVKSVTQCGYGCHRDFCSGPAVLNDTCEDAMLISGPTMILEDMEQFANDYAPPSSACSGAATGRDAVYRVDLAPGQVLKVRATAARRSTTPIVYLVEDCDELADTCLAAGRGATATPAELEFISTGGSYYVIVDGSSSASQDNYIIEFDFEQAQCSPGAIECVDANDRRVCSEVGLWETEPCPFGCDQDTDRCAVAPNDTCEGAYDATNGLNIEGVDLALYTNVYNSDDTPGSRCTHFPSHGQESVYFVDLERGDQVVATLTTRTVGSFNESAIWITSECNANAAAYCVAGSPRESRNATTATFRAQTAGRYYIMADTYAGTSYPIEGEFDLEITVTRAACQAEDGYCDDDGNLMYCRPDGSGFDSMACEGGCVDGRCVVPTGNVCPDAIDVSASTTLVGDFAALTANFDPGFAGCTGYDAPGRDAIYAVHLTAGRTLQATLANASGVRNDLSLYVALDCNDEAGTCVAGSDLHGDGPESVTYTATADTTVFLIADTWNTNATGEFLLSVDIQ